MRSIILVLSLVLGIVPLLGVGWIFASGMITVSPPSATVDGLFMTLILLTLSLCFLLNAYWEMRDQGLLTFMQKKKGSPVAATATSAKTTSGTVATPAPPAQKTPTAKVSS